MLYFVLSTPALLILGWNYVGGGNDIEKIHPATYLLFAGSCIALVINSQFRRSVVARVASDPSLVSFAAAVGITATYSHVAKGASIAPFIDTFFVAIIVTTIVSCISQKSLGFLHRLIDTFFLVNIFLIFSEAALHRDFFSEYLSGVTRTREVAIILGPQEATATFDRPTALFGHPLDAAMLLGVYSIANLASVPGSLSLAGIARVGLCLLSYMAIYLTGGRSAVVTTTILLLLYIAYAAVASMFRARLSKSAFVLVFWTVLLLIPVSLVLWYLGYFDSMMSRFEFDYGSALARDYAFEMLQQASMSELWFGLSAQDLFARQQDFGLTAIEIAWINFILVGGLVTAIPLFITYCLFLFRSTRQYCVPGIYFISWLIFVVTSSSNGIWSKTTTLTTSLAVGITFLRRDIHRRSSFTSRTSSTPLHLNGLISQSVAFKSSPRQFSQ